MTTSQGIQQEQDERRGKATSKEGDNRPQGGGGPGFGFSECHSSVIPTDTHSRTHTAKFVSLLAQDIKQYTDDLYACLAGEIACEGCSHRGRRSCLEDWDYG